MSDGVLSGPYAIPSVLGVVSALGLFAALLVDGVVEWLAIAAIAIPLVAVAIALRNGWRA